MNKLLVIFALGCLLVCVYGKELCNTADDCICRLDEVPSCENGQCHCRHGDSHPTCIDDLDCICDAGETAECDHNNRCHCHNNKRAIYKKEEPDRTLWPAKMWNYPHFMQSKINTLEINMLRKELCTVAADCTCRVDEAPECNGGQCHCNHHPTCIDAGDCTCAAGQTAQCDDNNKCHCHNNKRQATQCTTAADCTCGADETANCDQHGSCHCHHTGGGTGTCDADACTTQCAPNKGSCDQHGACHCAHH